MINPKVSVVMSVYNGESHLRNAIDSILNQTFTDFEFIVINDGSTDGTQEILASYEDVRIKIVYQENRGLIKSLNRGVSLSNGEFIARQDADDISMPERFEKQLSYLEANPDCGLIGTWTHVINEEGTIIDKRTPRTDHLNIVIRLAFFSQFVHSSTMFRNSCFHETGGYDEKMLYVEDYDLWVRMSTICKVANLPEFLQMWRHNETTGITVRKRYEQKKNAKNIKKRYVSHLLSSKTLNLFSKIYILIALPYVYFRYYFYHSITSRKIFKTVKILASLKRNNSNRSNSIAFKIVLLLCLPFLYLKHYVRKFLRHKKRKAF